MDDRRFAGHGGHVQIGGDRLSAPGQPAIGLDFHHLQRVFRIEHGFGIRFDHELLAVVQETNGRELLGERQEPGGERKRAGATKKEKGCSADREDEKQHEDPSAAPFCLLGLGQGIIEAIWVYIAVSVAHGTSVFSSSK